MTATAILTPVRFCPKCQCDTERHADGRCRPCKRAYLYQWRKSNPEKFRAIQNVWDAKNEDKLKAAAAALYVKHRDTKISQAKAYYEKNKAKLAPKKAAWQVANADLVRISWQNRRAQKKASGGKLSKDLAEKLFSLQKGKCVCCGLPLKDGYHLDHIIPLALGGSNTDDNMQLLRQRCNNQKHAKHPVDFMQERGFLL